LSIKKSFFTSHRENS